MNSSEATDRMLVLRAQRGEPAAFGELVNRYMQRAYFAALGLVGSPDEALDLSQEAFARAFRARGRLDPERPFFPWLYQIIRRLCFNHSRDRAAHRRKLEGAGSWLADTTMGEPPADPEREFERTELREQVAREACRRSGVDVRTLRHVAVLHVKRSAHAEILDRLGLGPEHSIYLEDCGHVGQIDPLISLKRARDAGRFRDGDVALLLAAGIGYVWNAMCVRWQEE